MQCLIQKAQKGDAQAMTKVFDSNKSTIWFLCRMLQQNETEADQAASVAVQSRLMIMELFLRRSSRSLPELRLKQLRTVRKMWNRFFTKASQK